MYGILLPYVIPYGKRALKTAAIATLAVCSAGTALAVLLMRWRKKRVLRKKAKQTKKRSLAAIQEQLKKLENKDGKEMEEILCMDPNTLICAAQDGQIDPLTILHTFTYKACSVNKQLNCLTGLIKDAESVSLRLNIGSAKQCKLYGLPVSLKESLQTKGMEATVGLAQHIGNTAADDCVVAKVLKHCGAVPFVKTNLAQMMISFESSNPVFGETVNPQNPKFTPGGSSAGEGALIGAGGSPLGFGTDTGGSIRCPAHMCGIAGLKPSLDRISMKGLKGMPGCIGPMARNVDTLVLAMRALLCPLMFELDVKVPPLPFNEEMYSSTNKLRIGYYLDDGYNEPVPPIKRAVALAKEALEKAGHTLVPFQVPRVEEAMKILTSIFYGDGSTEYLSMVEYEELDPSLYGQYRKWRCPFILRWIISKVVGLKWPRISQHFYIHGGGNRSVDRLRKIEADLEKYRDEFHDLWREHHLDALICPPFPVVAGPLGSLEDLSVMENYCGLYNLLNYPAGVVPVTKVNESDMEALKHHRGHYGDPWDKHIKKTCEGSIGVSVGVQCVALPFKDEMCLRVMKEIESLILL